MVGVSFFGVIFVIFLIVVSFFIVLIITKNTSQMISNNNSPTLTEKVKVVSRRTESKYYNFESISTYSNYYVTFEFDSGERLELKVKGEVYGTVVEGDNGFLTYQGKRYKNFIRSFEGQYSKDSFI